MYLTNNLKSLYLTSKAIFHIQNVCYYLLFRLLEPLILYLFYASFGTAILGEGYLHFIIIGNIIFVIASRNISNLLQFFRYEKFIGTLSLNLVSPSSILSLLLKRSALSLLDSLFVSLVSSLYAIFLFGINIAIRDIYFFLFAIIIISLASLIFGVLCACVSLMFRDANLFINLLYSGIQIFCGVNFPITLFPNVIQSIVIYLPFTNGILAVRSIISGQEYDIVISYLLREITISIVVLFISTIIIKFMVNRVRNLGYLF